MTSKFLHETVSLINARTGCLVSEMDTIALYVSYNGPPRQTRRHTPYSIGDDR